MRTGFQRVAQVLSDTLMREMPHTPQESSRKLVVFSDSRQDAAKLSAGMRFAHYRDAVRQALATALETAGRGALAFQRQLTGASLSAGDTRLAQEFAATHPSEVAALSLAQNPALANQQAPGFAGLTYAVAAQQILQRGEHGPFPFSFSPRTFRPVFSHRASILAASHRMYCGPILTAAINRGAGSTSGSLEGNRQYV